jgi:hypothetical protein
MADEVNPSPQQGTENAQPSQAPTDFREYAKWRATGELPEAKDEQTPAAAEEDPPAKTDPDSGTAETDAEGEEENREDSEVKIKGGSRMRRIDRLTREKEELAREVEELRRAAATAAPQDRPSPAAPARTAGMPEPSDYATLAEYQLALTEWTIDRRETARKEAEEKAAAESAERQQLADWNRKLKAAQKAHADFDELLDSVRIPTGPATLAVRQALLEDEHGAEILYQLASHPEDFASIMAMSPASGIIAIGKLSASFDRSSPAPENGKPKITGAPKPPPPSSRPGKVMSDSIDDPDVQKDFKRWAKAREAQLKGR